MRVINAKRKNEKYSLHSLTVVTSIPSAILKWLQSFVTLVFGRKIYTVCRLRHKCVKMTQISDLCVTSTLWGKGYVQIQTGSQNRFKPQSSALQLYCNKISGLIRKLKEYQRR